jgi:hypothetical protein
MGINKHITAMFSREKIKLTKLSRLPSGREMAAFCGGVWITNIYVPLAHPIDRTEKIYKVWIFLIASNNDHRVDFNCVLIIVTSLVI